MRRVLLAGCWLALLNLLGCGRLRFEDLGDNELPHDGGVMDGDVPPDDTGLLDAGAADTSLARDAGGDLDGDLDGGVLDAEPLDDTGADALTGDAGSCPAGLSGATCTTCVRFVDVNSKAATPDGLSWATAFPDVIAGLVAAAAESEKTQAGPWCETWVREGRYFIFTNSVANTIPISPIVPLFGGFAGTEREPSERVIAAHPSILDGGEAQGTQRVYHPLYSTSGGTVDGFTVTRGLANAGQAPHGDGGGLRVSGGMLFLRNMLFTGNNTTGKGGAIYAQNAVVTIDNSRFLNNTADGSGGAIAVEPVGAGVEAWLTLRTSELRSNVAGGNGGGLYSSGAVTLTLENLVVAQNAAGGGGGGVGIAAGRGTLLASTFHANTAGSSASGLQINCIAAGCSVRNSIFWDPSTLPDLLVSGTVSLRHDTVRGGATGTSILTSDPLFVSAPGNLHLGATSPAIDSAEGCAGPERDSEGAPRRDIPGVANTGVGPVFSDRGAFEYQTGGTSYAPFTTVCP